MASTKLCFKLCTFDVTNTLLKFRIPVGEQYAKVGRMYGVERDPDQVSRAFRQNWKEMNSSHPNYGSSSGFSSRHWWKEIVRRTFTQDSSDISPEQLNLISHHLYEVYKTDACWNTAQGTESLLKHLKHHGLILGVISNFDERLDCVLESNGLASYFNFVLSSYVVKMAKPDRKIFDLALSQTSGIVASEALHIGDDVALDYFAAKKAGWKALLLAQQDAQSEISKDVIPNEIVNSIQQIEQHIFNS